MAVKVDLSQLSEEFPKALDHYSEELQKAIYKATDKSVNYLHQKLPNPPPKSGKKMKFSSRKQFLFVVNAIQDGRIQVPYRRTGNVTKEFTTRVDTRSVSGYPVYEGILGTRLKYAPWVVAKDKTADGRGPQSKYHEGNWWILEEEVTKHLDRLRDFYLDEARKVLNKVD